MSVLHTSTGILRYGSDYRLVLAADQGIVEFYRSLIPKAYYVQPSRWRAHITVVRTGKEVPEILDVWGRYEGEEVEFVYSPEIHEGEVYFWLNVFCKRLEDIRKELGLSVVSRYTLPPEGFTKCFHMTIGNKKILPKVTCQAAAGIVAG